MIFWTFLTFKYQILTLILFQNQSGFIILRFFKQCKTSAEIKFNSFCGFWSKLDHCHFMILFEKHSTLLIMSIYFKCNVKTR